MTMERTDNCGHLSTHWSLGTLILVGLASSEFAGAATIVALPLAALAAALGSWSAPLPNYRTPKRRKLGDVVEFLEIWMEALEFLAAAATCARVASTTMDYMSRGRLRDWLFGLESHSLGEPWPDVLGIAIVVVTTTLFMLGLDRSPSLSILLYVGLAASFIFFVLIGSLHTDTIFWNWAEDFQVSNWKSILVTAAMCAYSFPTNVSADSSGKKSCLKFGCFIVVPLLCYLLIVVVFTLMSHFRELSGTAIPLVRVFEVRDVDWARPVMATCTIFVACIAITEIIPSMYRTLMRLASKEWRMLVSSLLYQNSSTGAPVLAIFTVGSLTSILAFACPLSYLVGLLNVSPLIKCALGASRTLFAPYKCEYVHEDLSVQHTNIQYSRLQRTAAAKRTVIRPSPAARIKTAFDMMPRFLRTAAAPSGSRGGTDKECLLLDDYSHQDVEQRCRRESVEADSDSESVDGEGVEQELQESSSSTDVDAVVREYREQVRVATVDTFSDRRVPTRFTSRAAFGAIAVAWLSGCTFTWSILDGGHHAPARYASLAALIGVASSALVLSFTPRQHQHEENHQISTSKNSFFDLPLAFLGVVLNALLATAISPSVWLGLTVWTCGGLMLFCRCDCCSCEGMCPVANSERVLLRAATLKDVSGGSGGTSTCAFAPGGHQHAGVEHADAVLITR